MAGPIIHYNRAQVIPALRRGDLVAIPTETVYGLAAHACNSLAVAKIYATKERPQFNPLITHVSNLQQAQLYGIFNDLALHLAEQFWPGPLTMVVPQTADCTITPLVRAGLETIALRIPNHPIALDILQDFPLAAPSANPSGYLSPTRPEHVAESFKKFQQPVYIIDDDGKTLGLESTIIQVYDEYVDILRHGHITRGDLEQHVKVKSEYTNAAKPTSPGQLLQHYSPHNAVRLNATTVSADELLLAFGEPLLGTYKTLNLSLNGDLIEAAANLFKMLHELDDIPGRVIAVMPIPAEGLGIAINDRLKRTQADQS